MMSRYSPGFKLLSEWPLLSGGEPVPFDGLPGVLLTEHPYYMLLVRSNFLSYTHVHEHAHTPTFLSKGITAFLPHASSGSSAQG